jgi:hypothetical protein
MQPDRFAMEMRGEESRPVQRPRAGRRFFGTEM